MARVETGGREPKVSFYDQYGECVSVLTVFIPGDEVSETKVDIGIGLQEGDQLAEGVAGKQFSHFCHVLYTLPQETLPLSFILDEQYYNTE